jgi:hypothetical protein
VDPELINQRTGNCAPQSHGKWNRVFPIWADAKLVFRLCPSEEWPLCPLVHPLVQINRPPTDALRGETFFSFGQNIVAERRQRWTCQSFANAVDPHDKHFLVWDKMAI